MTHHVPTTEPEACAVIAEAAARRVPLALVGGGTKAGIGRPAQSEATLAAAGLAGITLYEPAELVIAARAGTPLPDVVAALEARGQRLPFEPMDHRVLLGDGREPTLGGGVAANVSGPRRIVAGAARDSLIGVRFVNGRGELIRSGGRVMKNVTGLDLVKLMAGSWGTLGFLTEVTVKVLPKPERVATLVLEGLDDAAAVGALAAALGSPFEVTGAAHLPAGLHGEAARTAIRIEGFRPSVDYRLGELRRLLRRSGAAGVLEDDEADALWAAIRDVAPLASPRTEAVWRVSTAPSRAPALVAAIGAALTLRHFYDWGGGLVWLATSAQGDAGASVIREALRQTGGHATLVRAPAELRAAVDPFEPPAPALMRLTQGVKASLDPAGVLNPGRMYAGV